MAESAKALGFQVGLEPQKRHPREPFNYGRLRILLKDKENRPTNSKITSRIALLNAISKGYLAAVENMVDPDGRIAKYSKFARSEISVRVPRAASPAPPPARNLAAPLRLPQSLATHIVPTPVISAVPTKAGKPKKKKKKTIRG